MTMLRGSFRRLQLYDRPIPDETRKRAPGDMRSHRRPPWVFIVDLVRRDAFDTRMKAPSGGLGWTFGPRGSEDSKK
jgi:hypothetical protein